jgi:uncharacterized protein (TIGR02996 family)
MNDETAFIRKICEEPDEDTHRLVFVDWLEEDGEPERAEFIRLGCELATIPHPNAVGECSECGTLVGMAHEQGCRFVALRARQRELWTFDPARYFGLGAAFWSKLRVSLEWFDTTRGFLDCIEVLAVPLLEHGDRLLWHPSQNRPCPRTAQPIRRVITSHNADGAISSSWSGEELRITWPGGFRTVPQTVPVEYHGLDTALRQVWPWIDFTLMPLPL